MADMADVSVAKVKETAKEWESYIRSILKIIEGLEQEKGINHVLTLEELHSVGQGRPFGQPHVSPCHPTPGR